MIRYFYIRQPNKKNPHHRGDPVACVAYQRSPDPDQEEQEIVTFAMSASNPDDEFNKPLARKIASGRLKHSRKIVDGFNVDRTTTSTEVIRELVSYVEDGMYSINVPTRVRNAAQKWMKNQARKIKEETTQVSNV